MYQKLFLTVLVSLTLTAPAWAQVEVAPGVQVANPYAGINLNPTGTSGVVSDPITGQPVLSPELMQQLGQQPEEPAFNQQANDPANQVYVVEDTSPVSSPRTHLIYEPTTY